MPRIINIVTLKKKNNVFKIPYLSDQMLLKLVFKLYHDDLVKFLVLSSIIFGTMTK